MPRKKLSAGRAFLNVAVLNPTKECSNKGFQNKVKPAKETHDSLEAIFEELLMEVHSSRLGYEEQKQTY